MVLICLLIIYLLNIIFIIICLIIHDKYITNFLNKINLDFQKEKNDFKWNLIILIYQILYIVLPLSIMVISNCFSNYINKNNGEKKDERYNDTAENINDDKIKELEKKIKAKDKEIKKLKEQNRQQESTNNILTINRNASETTKLKNELEEKKIE